MDNILNLIANGENVRLLAILVAIYCFYVLMKSQMKDMGHSFNKQIDELRGDMNSRIDELKHNDIAHLNSTIEALTYALEKNGTLKPEDKAYVDSRLATV